MIGSGSFCTVEGVKASAFGFPPVKPRGPWQVRAAEGGKGVARERRGNNENAVLYNNFRGGHCRGGCSAGTVIKKQVQRYSGSR